MKMNLLNLQKKKNKINNIESKVINRFKVNDRVKIIWNSDIQINGKAKLQYEKGEEFRHGIVTSKKNSKKSSWLSVKCKDATIPIRSCFLKKITKN